MFSLGQVVVTPTACQVLSGCGKTAEDLLARHQQGDWGEISPLERKINDDGVASSMSIISSYSVPGGHQLNVFTRGDRSCTFVHLVPRTADTHV